ncbi:nicotinate phosphoribosyltransferase [Orrella sp. 11846]|uniref:nicotinate phosphoribosyltransferase n=1 Tax=Orrella sp. 11846 TaxID=3409913 RepID=UPI003B59CF6D
MMTSLLDTDLYKFTMMQLVLHHYPGAHVRYQFYCRTPEADFRGLETQIDSGVRALSQLRFSEAELTYLRSLPYLSEDFVSFLTSFQLPEQAVQLEVCEQTGQLKLQIQGLWWQTILFEVPVLALINEIYFARKRSQADLDTGRIRLQKKIEAIQAAQDLTGFRLVEYGTRRRYSGAWQDEVVSTLKAQLGLKLAGTSNVLLAKRHQLKPIGTMGHEYLQACQVLGTGPVQSQRFALDLWAREFRGEVSIALTDLYTLTPFLRDFDRYFCKLYDGVRHDSGDPLVWAERMLAHYHQHRIDAKQKTFVFSDGLTIQRALEIERYIDGRAGTFYGIGTQLTNDVGHEPLQIVIKMTHCEGYPVAKLSENPAKAVCEDPHYLAYLRQSLAV